MQKKNAILFLGVILNVKSISETILMIKGHLQGQNINFRVQ